MSLAEKLVTIRKQKGLTQMDLAERLNVSRQAISRWEVGAAVTKDGELQGTYFQSSSGEYFFVRETVSVVFVANRAVKNLPNET